MRIAAFAVLALAASVALVQPVAASPLLVTTGGTFNSVAPTTAWSAPNEAWSLSFNVDSNPVPTSFSSGVAFTFAPTNEIYTLNGSPVSGTLAVEFVTSSGYEGGFWLCFSSSTCVGFDNFVARGSQYYTGPESAPTINTVAGSTYSSAGFIVGAVFYSQPSGAITIANATPEPSTFLLTFAGAALLVLKRKRGTSA